MDRQDRGADRKKMGSPLEGRQGHAQPPRYPDGLAPEGSRGRGRPEGRDVMGVEGRGDREAVRRRD